MGIYEKLHSLLSYKTDRHKKRVLFLTSNDFGFGGSEELWSLSALRMVSMSYIVGVSVRAWKPEPTSIRELEKAGCSIFRRSVPVRKKDYLSILKFRPDLVVISQGSNFEALSWMKFLTKIGVDYVNIIHCVHEASWPGIDDALIQEINGLYQKSKRVYFVSDGNRKLHEKMTGFMLNNAGIVRNPFKVSYHSEVSWPEEDSFLHVASVGRLECFHKGSDILLEVLSKDKWKDRKIKFHFYGDGPHKELLRRLTRMWGVSNVTFEGLFDNIESIWQHNHALVQPSRLEGLPLTVVEAMLCQRMVVATDVAGHGEVIVDEVSGFIARAPTAEFLDEALERAWSCRADWQELGINAGIRIRTIIPEDPTGDFVTQLTNNYLDIC